VLQDGLLHVSQLADRFVKDALEVVKAGDVVNVRVVEVDIKRKRIGLSMRKDGGGEKPAPREPAGKHRAAPLSRQPERPASQGAFGAALADAMKRK
jgi:uncharacterized protein